MFRLTKNKDGDKWCLLIFKSGFLRPGMLSESVLRSAGSSRIIFKEAPKTPNRLRFPPCRLGEHNEYVYKEVIGVSDEEYAELDEVVQELQRELLNQLSLFTLQGSCGVEII